jgi:hypothetical protein
MKVIDIEKTDELIRQDIRFWTEKGFGFEEILKRVSEKYHDLVYHAPERVSFRSN